MRARRESTAGAFGAGGRCTPSSLRFLVTRQVGTSLHWAMMASPRRWVTYKSNIVGHQQRIACRWQSMVMPWRGQRSGQRSGRRAVQHIRPLPGAHLLVDVQVAWLLPAERWWRFAPGPTWSADGDAVRVRRGSNHAGGHGQPLRARGDAESLGDVQAAQQCRTGLIRLGPRGRRGGADHPFSRSTASTVVSEHRSCSAISRTLNPASNSSLTRPRSTRRWRPSRSQRDTSPLQPGLDPVGVVVEPLTDRGQAQVFVLVQANDLGDDRSGPYDRGVLDSWRDNPSRRMKL